MTQTRRRHTETVTSDRDAVVESSTSGMHAELAGLTLRVEAMARRLLALEERIMVTATPVEYITISEAAARYQPHDENARRLMRIKIQHWVDRKRFDEHDIQRDGRGPGPGGLVRINWQALQDMMENPPKPGPKPRKS